MDQFTARGEIECKEVPMGSAGGTFWLATVHLGDLPSSLLLQVLPAASEVCGVPGVLEEVEPGLQVFRAMGETENRARKNLNDLLLQAQVLAVALLQDLQDLCPLTQGRA